LASLLVLGLWDLDFAWPVVLADPNTGHFGSWDHSTATTAIAVGAIAFGLAKSFGPKWEKERERTARGKQLFWPNVQLQMAVALAVAQTYGQAKLS